MGAIERPDVPGPLLMMIGGGALPWLGALLVSRTNSGVVLAFVPLDLSSSSPLHPIRNRAKSDAQTMAIRLRVKCIMTGATIAPSTTAFVMEALSGRNSLRFWQEALRTLVRFWQEPP